MTTHARLKRLEQSLDAQRRDALHFLHVQAQRPHTRLSACVDRQRARAAELGVTEPDDPRLQHDPDFMSATTAVLAESCRLVRARWPLVYRHWLTTWPEQHPCLRAAADLLEAQADGDTCCGTPGSVEVSGEVSPEVSTEVSVVVAARSDPEPGERAGDAGESEW
jgi:hypothetical protein